MLYNDAYALVLGGKHPWAMGRDGSEVWAEIWPVIEPLLQEVIDTGKALRRDDLLLHMQRSGYEEETYFSFCYAPILNESGNVGGIFTPVVESTEKVISARRFEILRLLANQPRAVHVTQACEAAAELLNEHPLDVPFGLIYLIDEAQQTATLASAIAVAAGSPIAPASIDIGDTQGCWLVKHAISSNAPHTLTDLTELGRDLPLSPWGTQIKQALLLPITLPGNAQPVALLIAGVSPHRALDSTYLSFYALLADTLKAALAESLAHEEERKRAVALAEIDRAKTAFFSNISHEFRTPLTLMLGPIEDLLNDAALPEPARSQLLLLQRNSQRLFKLVNSLLDFSRIEAGRAEAIYEPVELASFTAELAGVFRSAIEKAVLQLSVQCPPLQEPVFADREMWEKIVFNLLSNAFKFTFDGSITVSIATEAAVEGAVEASAAILTVADTGAGIARERLPRLFERFHRVEGTRARTYEGSGIGLALVKDLVELHGGSLRVESEVGAGTSFIVRLPLGSAHLPGGQVSMLPMRSRQMQQAQAYMAETELWLSALAITPQSPASGTIPSMSAASTVDARILVVDDNPDMCGYVMRLLQSRWQVDCAAHGQEALESVARRRPDLIVSDVMMPVMDGFALLTALRANDATHDIPLVLLSARAGEEARIEALQAGADDYLVKPFSARELLAIADSLLLRSRLRAAERETARHLREVFEQAPVAISIFRGPEHVYEVSNQANRELLGQRDVLGKPLREAIPELEQTTIELFDRVYSSGQPYSGRAVRMDILRGDPPQLQECYFDVIYQPLFDSNGSVEGIAGVGFEVTELNKARRDAEVANLAKDDFLAILGHELRNPLSPILSALELMRLRGITGAEKERAIIERQAEHLVRLVDDLLDVSRIAQGKVRLNREIVEINAIVERAIEMASPLLDERRQLLHMNVQESGLLVEADAGRMAQVIANLLTNAAKYSDEDSDIRINAWRENDTVHIEVSDSGHGIANEILPRLFDMFVQDQQTLERSRGGLGLGLSIVRSITELHGGTVRVHSAGLKRGSAFTVSIPASVGTLAEAAALASAAASLAVAETAQSFCILIVDDNTDAAGTLADLLNAYGHRTHVAFDGISALQTAATFQPQIAIVDIGLPGMDGYELAAQLRQIPGLKNIELIALTGYGQEADRLRSKLAGINLHLIKPVTVEQLMRILNFLDLSSSPASN